MGFAERFLAGTFNRPHHELVDHRVYVICSDGDLMEGVSYEAGSLAGTNGLGKLVYFYDDNHITIDGTTSISFTEDRAKRFDALGWHVQSVADVNDLDALRAAISNAQAETERPSMIIVRSHIGFGAPHAVDTAGAHGSPLGAEEVAAAKRALGWDPDKQFYVPDEVAAHMNQTERGARLEREWQERSRRGRRRSRPSASGGTPRGPGRIGAWTPPVFEPGEELATRAAGKSVMQAFKDAVPTMIGGAADLVESTYTEFVGGGLFSGMGRAQHPVRDPRARDGLDRQRHRAHGGCVKPYGSTFLIFSDYMRPAVRLSALMELPVVWAWTHDSVGLGEDGPTHQPVETYAALRAIPHLWFIRPADANETAVAWKVALERLDGPVALSLSRQKVPTLDRERARRGLGARTRCLHPLGVVPFAGPDPDRHRRRSRARARRRAPARDRRHVRAGRLDALLGALRGAAGRVPRRGAATRGEGATLDRAGRRARLEAVGRRQRRLDLDRALRRLGAGRDGARRVRLQPRQRRRPRSRLARTGRLMAHQADCIKQFFSLVSPGFMLEGELPTVELEAIEERHDGHAIARVRADGRVLPIRFTFDEGKIARVEVL